MAPALATGDWMGGGVRGFVGGLTETEDDLDRHLCRQCRVCE